MTQSTVSIGLSSGQIELVWPGFATSGPVRARALLADGSEHLSAGWSEGDGGYTAACGPLDVRLGMRASGGCVRLDLRATARSAVEVAELGLRLEPRLDAGAIPAWMVYSGYQSWDASGIAASPAGGSLRSWWTAGLALDSGVGLAASALSAHRASTRFDFDGASLLVMAGEPEGPDRPPGLWSARPGGSWRSDAVVLGAGADVRAELRKVASRVRGRPADGIPRGWLSWYHYGPWVTRDDVLANASELVDGRLAGRGYSIVQVDDGWQKQYGDWSPNEKFPGGLAAVAAELAPRGLRLGVWTAPFLVAATSELAASAPDSWFVRDPATGGRATDPVHVVFGPMYVLDARNPEVRAHLKDTFRALRAEGVSYFKIDFLYAGGYAGTRALRAGVRAIREGAGEDAYLLACGAPLLPMVGLCEGCRIGRDTATPVFDFESDSPKPALIEDEIADVARNLAARHFLDSWFQLDPDVALVGGNLTPGQARACVTFCALSGGPFFASDAIPALDGERLRLLTEPGLLALVGGRPALPDWAPAPGDRAAAAWRRDDVVAVFNWEDRDLTFDLDIGGSGSLLDIWSGEVCGRTADRIKLEVPARDVRLMRHLPD